MSDTNSLVISKMPKTVYLNDDKIVVEITKNYIIIRFDNLQDYIKIQNRINEFIQINRITINVGQTSMMIKGFTTVGIYENDFPESSYHTPQDQKIQTKIPERPERPNRQPKRSEEFEESVDYTNELRKPELQRRLKTEYENCIGFFQLGDDYEGWCIKNMNVNSSTYVNYNFDVYNKFKKVASVYLRICNNFFDTGDVIINNRMLKIPLCKNMLKSLFETIIIHYYNLENYKNRF